MQLYYRKCDTVERGFYVAFFKENVFALPKKPFRVINLF